MFSERILLPKLNKLSPTMESTLLKAVEEAGELARAVLQFLPYESQELTSEITGDTATKLLSAVAEELLDVAQTCVTMIFVLEDGYAIQVDHLLDAHLEKLVAKGYLFDGSQNYHISTQGRYKALHLPRLGLEQVTLLTTVCKIQEELGEFTQFIGKKSGASGESAQLSQEEALQGAALELLDIAQCCFTMMYILAERHAVHMGGLLEKHVAKLQSKGYCG